MKVLHFAGYVTIDDDKEFSKNASGYGYMVFDICKSIQKKEVETFILTQSNITKGKISNDLTLIKRTWIDIFSNVNPFDIFKFFSYLFNKKTRIGKIPNIFLYHISLGYFRKIIKRENFDLIHIHGVGDYTCPMIDECHKQKHKFLVTLHGLNFLRSDLHYSDVKQEKKYLKFFHENNIPVTVISTGIRTKILKLLKINNSKTFSIINNGFRNDKELNLIDVRKEYNILNDKKIMLCVGNICKNKNQEQIIRSFSLLNDNIKKQLYILFIGSDLTKGFNKKIDFTKSSNLIFCGKIDKKLMASFYSQSDFNILASIAEGFGLSIIEALYFGIPSIIFNDIDIYEDIDKTSIIGIKNRTDEALAKGIEKMFLASWDSRKISKSFKKFDIEEMANKYLLNYKAINENK
tara:strand:+ start:13436 stop:14653 length:1218 start_codon:yes stop_codon:yes gene_type:complete